MTHKIIAQGAEAIIYKIKDKVVKDRTKKSYRIPELDLKIRRRRTRSEAKLLTKASALINCPKPLEHPGSGRMIHLPFINGKKLSEHLDKFSLTKQKQILGQIGKDVAKLHNNEIIHGDLTTSNMIIVESIKKTDNFKKLLRRLERLKLPIKEYTIFASGPLIIRGLRDSHDIDILVSKKIFKEYKEKPGWKLTKFNRDGRQVEMLEKGKIEFYYTWGPGKWDPKKIIQNSEIINGIPFANLNDFIKWKKISGRVKDKKDLKLISQYQSSKNKKANFKVYFIDFGLGFISKKYEDKAVDVHLLKQALEAKHFKNWETLFKEFEKAYKSINSKEAEKTFNQLVKVEKRGRYKH